MTLFEKELRNILEGVDYKVSYVGDAAYIFIGDNRVKVRFVTTGIHEQYDALLLIALNKNTAEIDRNVRDLCDVIGTKPSSNPNFKATGIKPHIWRDMNGKYEWYGYVPTAEDYSKLRKYVLEYVGVFE